MKTVLMRTLADERAAAKKMLYYKLDVTHFLRQKWFDTFIYNNYGVHVAGHRLLDQAPATVEMSYQGSDAGPAGGFGCIQFLVSIIGYQYLNFTYGLDAKTKATAEIRVEPLEAPSFAWKFKEAAHGVATSGWDPEIFVEDEKGDVIPAFHFLPDKSNPKFTTADFACVGIDRGNVYYDGFQAEFTTRAQSCHGYGMDYIRGGLHAVLENARKHYPKAKLSSKSVFPIPGRFLQNGTPDQIGLGCKPSLNVYGRESFTIEDPRMLPVRVAGGHIHFGFTRKHQTVEAIKALDRFAGLATVGMFDEVDDPMRREFYGRAGEYRGTQYGYEYRVLSNAWLCAPEIAHVVMELTRGANRFIGFTNEQLGWKLEDKQVEEIINYCDVKAARKIIKKHWNLWSMLLTNRFYDAPQALPLLYQAIQCGVHSVYPEFENIERNWHLEKGATWLRHSNNSEQTWRAFALRNTCKSTILQNVPFAKTATKPTSTAAVSL
jgi:hypothetical protein